MILILKIFIVLFSLFFIILFSSDFLDILTGNIEERIFSKDAATESFIYYSKAIYITYTLIELLFLISLLLITFFKKIHIKYLVILLVINIVLILLPIIVTK